MIEAEAGAVGDEFSTRRAPVNRSRLRTAIAAIVEQSKRNAGDGMSETVTGSLFCTGFPFAVLH